MPSGEHRQPAERPGWAQCCHPVGMKSRVSPRAVALLAVAAAAVTACSSGGHAAGTSTTSAPTSSAASASTSPSGAGSGASLPAVAHATDMKVEPLPAAGNGPAPTTLLTRNLVVGTGTAAGSTSTVEVQYVGANYADGKVFDSSWSRGQPTSFPLNGVIPGFAQGIVGMKVGGRREIVIPPALGYGDAGSPPAVAPNETLVFVVDLLSVR